MAIEEYIPEQTGAALVPYQPRGGMIAPLDAPAALRRAVDQFEAVKKAIVRKDDEYTQSGKTFLKKSFWRRVATCFGLSLDLVSQEYIADEATGTYGYSVVYRATAPNGQSMVGDGLCMSDEKRDKSGRVVPTTRHIVRATAHTRAKNRAISDLIGGGEVSAEEVAWDDDPHTVESGNAAKPTQKQWGTLQARALQAGKVKNLGEWEAAIKRVTGKAMRDCTMADYNAVIADLAKPQQQAEQAESDPDMTFTPTDAEGHELAGAFGTRGA